MYNAVIISKLIYGLETMYLNDSLIKRLDAFHMIGLRHILGIEHAYWSRTSNEEILERADAIACGHADILAQPNALVVTGLLCVCELPREAKPFQLACVIHERTSRRKSEMWILDNPLRLMRVYSDSRRCDGEGA